MTRQFLLGLAAYVVPSFPLALIWHLTIFAKNYAALDLLRPDVIVPLGLLTMLIQGAFFSWAYPRLFSTAPGAWLSSAARCAGVYGLIAWSYSVLAVAAKIHMTSVADFVVLESGWTLLQFAVSTPLMALAWRDRSN